MSTLIGTLKTKILVGLGVLLSCFLILLSSCGSLASLPPPASIEEHPEATAEQYSGGRQTSESNPILTPNADPTPNSTIVPRIPITTQNAALVEQVYQFGSGWVNTMAYSPDGQLLALATSLGIEIYDAVTSEEIRHIDTNLESCTSVAFSPDGTLVAAGYSHTATIWYVSNGTVYQQMTAYRGGITEIAYSPDGTYLAAGTRDGSIDLWQVTDGSHILSLTTGHWIQDMDFSPDGSILAAGAGSTIYFWSIPQGALLKAIGLDSTLTAFNFSQDGTTVASVSENGVIQVSELASGESILEIRYENNEDSGERLQYVDFLADGSTLITNTNAGNVLLWQISSGDLLEVFPVDLTDQVNIAVSPDGSEFATCSMVGAIQIWQLPDGGLEHTLDRYFIDIPVVTFSPDSSLYAFPFGRDVLIYRTSNNVLVQRIQSLPHQATSLAFSPDGSLLAVGSGDSEITIWRVSDGGLEQTVQNENLSDPHHMHLAFSPDGTLLSASGADGVNLFQISDGALLYSFSVEAEMMVDFAFSPDGNLIAATSGNDIYLWDLANSDHPLRLRGHTNAVNALDFSPDNSMLISSSIDNSIRLWNVNTGGLIRSIFGPTQGINDVAVSPNGTLIASSAGDGTGRIWRVSNGACLQTLTISHSEGFVVFSPDGTLLATSDSGVIRFWGVP
ncbi:MAG TPA: WD40 repeat domain-containing protein [Longilinea sp.]|nr:WD40 repeat domain-containing protein [Longilinea sp.]